uniref:Uncharacterized protein n=1 Tax=Oryza rufipogon TaxID=4529 RepID=A0A0E0P821_ORYRU
MVSRSGSGCASHLRWGMRDRAGKHTGVIEEGDGIGAEEQHGKEGRRRCAWVRILPHRRHDFGEVARMKAWHVGVETICGGGVERCGKTIGLASGVLSWEIKEERSVQGIWLEPEEDDEMSTDLAGIWDERGSRRWA